MFALGSGGEGDGVVQGLNDRLAKREPEFLGFAGDAERGECFIDDARVVSPGVNRDRRTPRRDREFVASEEVVRFAKLDSAIPHPAECAPSKFEWIVVAGEVQHLRANLAKAFTHAGRALISEHEPGAKGMPLFYGDVEDALARFEPRF